jgi:hypothetical protein
MATTTTRLGLRKPQDTTPDDPVDVVADIDNNMDKLDSAASGEVVTAFPVSPFIGKIVIRSDLNSQAYIYDGTAWRAIVTGRSDTLLPRDVFDNTAFNSTSATYEAGTPELSTTFKAPLSGVVWVNLGVILRSTSTSSAWASFEIRLNNSGGSVVTAASDDRAVNNQNNSYTSGGNRVSISGLTPITQTYFIRIMVKTSNAANAANIFSRRLVVEPYWGGAV